MNANWHGLLAKHELVSAALEKIVTHSFGKSDDAKYANQWYSVFASGPGIFGLGSRIHSHDPLYARLDSPSRDGWSLTNPDHVNGGTR